MRDYEKLIADLREMAEWIGPDPYELPITIYDRLVDAADAIEKLCKRVNPMRVRITTSTKRCPCCNKQVSGRGNIHSNYLFCRWCGQALDWTEPPKEDDDG